MFQGRANFLELKITPGAFSPILKNWRNRCLISKDLEGETKDSKTLRSSIHCSPRVKLRLGWDYEQRVRPMYSLLEEKGVPLI